MRKVLWAGLVALVVGAVLYGSHRSVSAYEVRAQAAEQYAVREQARIVQLQESLTVLARQQAIVHTRVIRLTDSIRVVDENQPPADTCRPNLAIRDAVIAAQGQELDIATSRIISQNLVILVQMRVIDTLWATLHARPRPSRFVPRNLGLGLVVGVDLTGAVRVGVGLSINIGGIRL